MAAPGLALFDDRLAFLVSELPAEEILKIALHGLRNSGATRRFATERYAEIHPLPPRFVSGVLLSDDLLPKIFSPLSPRDGGRASGAGRKWNSTWKAVFQSRALTHVQTVGPTLPWVEAGREPLAVKVGLLGFCALPNGEVMIGAHTSRGIFHCTPGFKVKRQITHHGDLALGCVSHIVCDADTIFIQHATVSNVASFKVSDLSPLQRGDVDRHYYGPLTISADGVYVRTGSVVSTIAVLHKASLVERSRFGGGVLGVINAMAVLGEWLYVSDDDGYPRARVHIFSLEGEHSRTVNFSDVWSINELAAARGWLFATELVEPDVLVGDDVVEAGTPPAYVGKRVLMLSPQLEVLHEFRGVPGELEDADFYGMAPRGDNELLVANFARKEIYVLSVPRQ